MTEPVFAEIEALEVEGAAALRQASDPESLEQVRVSLLGRSGRVREYMGRIKDVPAQSKKEYGRCMNRVKQELTRIAEERKRALATSGDSGPRPDPTLPGQAQPRGRVHPLTSTVERISGIFERLGFSVVDGPEVEDDFHNFDALNIPPDHPVRDMADTFFLSDGSTLRSQTSTVQIRVMEKNEPPIRIIAPGRVYRPDTVDATHHYGFSQVEGLAVDENVSFADLKGILEMFCKEMFGSETRTRFRPSFFPFTEPSAEVDVSCIFCGGKGCRVCKDYGWIEVMGCGMVDPNVFAAVGYDPEKWTGFAFGMGIERVAMLTLGINDIRLFYENDLRFLRQF